MLVSFSYSTQENSFDLCRHAVRLLHFMVFVHTAGSGSSSSSTNWKVDDLIPDYCGLHAKYPSSNEFYFVSKTT